MGTAVYPLRGFRCTAIGKWLAAVGPIAPRPNSAEWLGMFQLADALNPIGERTRLLDRSQLTGLDSSAVVASLDGVRGARQPRIRELTGGKRAGEVTVLWSDIGYHGSRIVRWTFELGVNGQLVNLTEQSLDGIGQSVTWVNSDCRKGHCN